MKSKSDTRIGVREFVVTVSFATGMKLTDTTPVLLMEIGKNAAWMIPLVSDIIILIPFLALLSILKKYNDKSLIQVIYILCGKYIGFIIAASLFLITFLSTALQTRIYVDILKTLFYARTPLIFLYGFFMGGAWFIARLGFEAVASTCWATFWMLLAVLVVLVGAGIPEYRVSYLFPLEGPGISEVIKGGIYYSSILADVLIMGVFFPYVKSYKKYKTASLLGFEFSVLVIVLFLMIYIMVFGYPTINLVNYPYQQFTKIIRFSRFWTHLEGVFLGFWVMASVIRFAIYLSAAETLLGHTLKLKEFKYLLFPLTTAAIILGMIPENYSVTTLIGRDYFLKIASIYLPVLFLLLWMIHKIKGGKGNED